MSAAFHAPLGALFALLLTSGPALAGAAITSVNMTGRAGPGDSFKPVWTAVAGSRVDVQECDIHHWCRVDYQGAEGWVHVKGVDPKVKHTGVQGAPGDGFEAGGTGASGGDSGSAESPDTGVSSTTGGGSSGGGFADRQSPAIGGNNFERPHSGCEYAPDC